jgi:osmotically-inducible protein OsmY
MLPVYPLLNIESGDIVEIKAMPDEEEILKEVRAAFEREPRIDPHHYPIRMEIAEDGALILEGTVKNVAAKKLGLELAAATPGVCAIVDRLRVAPSATMTDDEICDHVRNALLQEPAMLNCAIRVRAKGRVENVRAAMAEPPGFIEIAVEDGNVLLEGQAPSLSHKRLAGVLAWWVPGSANVLNCIEVTPPEEDNDDEITDATRIALEKDPFVNADQIRVTTRNRVVTMEGVAPNEDEKEMAEFDAWYVFGVDKVINKIEIQQL